MCRLFGAILAITREPLTLRGQEGHCKKDFLTAHFLGLDGVFVTSGR